jgi:hypothetical protein
VVTFEVRPFCLHTRFLAVVPSFVAFLERSFWDVVTGLSYSPLSGFGGLELSMLASGSRVRGFKPGRSRRIFLMQKSSACLPSEGKSNNLFHVPTLGHVKEPRSCSSLQAAGKIHMFSFLPSLIEVYRAAWCGVPLEMKDGTIPIRGTKGLSTRPRYITLITQPNL